MDNWDWDEVRDRHLKIASERASTNPEVATANALVAIAMFLASANFIHGNY